MESTIESPVTPAKTRSVEQTLRQTVRLLHGLLGILDSGSTDTAIVEHFDNYTPKAMALIAEIKRHLAAQGDAKNNKREQERSLNSKGETAESVNHPTSYTKKKEAPVTKNGRHQ